MITHLSLGSSSFARSRALKRLVDAGRISLGGNRRLRIYGRLTCRSGRRMKPQNRVFFPGEQEALDAGFRPCGHCMKQAYARWLAS